MKKRILKLILWIIYLSPLVIGLLMVADWFHPINKNQYAAPAIDPPYNTPNSSAPSYYMPACSEPRQYDSDSKTPDGAYDDGYVIGYEQGKEDGGNGYSHGANYDNKNNYFDSYETKYQEGYENGYNDGYSEGESQYEGKEKSEDDV